MMTMLSTFLSFLAGGLPKILEFFQDRQDKSHEIAILRMQKERELELAARGFQAQERIEEIKTEQVLAETYAQERVALYKHDEAIGKGASQWIINLRASVRPVVTYIFVLELVVLNATGVWYAYSTGIPFAVAMDNVFGEDEMLILSSIIAFWFGTQAFSKR
jgi:hypothetical protein